MISNKITYILMTSEQPTHRELLLQAKQRQKSNLHESAIISSQVARTVHALIQVNSVNTSNCPPVLDKITTVHEIDREIDRQLNKDIAMNYERFLREKDKLASFQRKTTRALAMKSETHESYVELLQRDVELIDQELRILEHTLQIVKDNDS